MKNVFKRNLASALIAPIALYPATFFAWFFLALLDLIDKKESVRSFGGATDGLELLFAIPTIGLIFAFPLTIIFGIPIALILQKLNIFKLPIILSLSLVPVTLLAVFISSFHGMSIFYYFSLAVAFSYWLVYERIKIL
jgi:hypothetical protein